MVETLVQRIKRKDTPDNPNRDQETREEFEQHALTNSVSYAVRGGKTYYQQYQNAFGKYDDLKSFRPFLLPDGFNESIADLEDAIGSSQELRGSLYTALENPIGMAGLFGSVIGIISIVAPSSIIPPELLMKEEISRRGLLKIGFGFGAIVGAVGGATLSYARFQTLKSLEQNAIYLDQTYSRVYKTASRPIEHPLLVGNYFQRFGIPNRVQTRVINQNI